MRRVLVVVLFGLMLLAGALLLNRAASAQGPLVGATDESVNPGANGTAELYAQNFSAPGLGAWTINIVYDPSVITVTSCGPGEGSTVCNPEYAGDTIRSAGADAFGLEGNSVLAEIQFTCSDSGGMTTLDVQPQDVSDATVGGPVLLDVEVAHGSVSCDGAAASTPTPQTGVQATPVPAAPVPAAPDAGTGQGTPEAPWQVFATLLALLSVGVTVVAGLRVFAQRES